MPAAATRIHGIADSDLNGAPGWPEACERLAACLAGCAQLRCWSIGYDRKMLDQASARHDVDDPLIAIGGELSDAQIEHAAVTGERRPSSQRFGETAGSRYRTHDLKSAFNRALRGNIPARIRAARRPLAGALMTLAIMRALAGAKQG